MSSARTSDLKDHLSTLRQRAEEAFAEAKDENALRAAHARFAGTKGELRQSMQSLKDVSAEERPVLGQTLNALKNEIESMFEQALKTIESRKREQELTGIPVDITLPGRGLPSGGLHPISRITQELLRIFTRLGFEVAEGPEIEWYKYNFDLLGFPPDHPATNMQDSFFVDAPSSSDRVVLRTHTSSVQIREMLRRKPPLAIVSPGVVYRRDDDATHSPMFFQLEGFLVDEGVTFAHLKGTLTNFIRMLFGEKTEVRFRPSYFPFVEPGGEVDIRWRRADGQERWLEILGCGMIHPVVLENVGYDAERYSGFAFGLGLDRVAMLKYGISDIRLLYENDLRFLERVQ